MSSLLQKLINNYHEFGFLVGSGYLIHFVLSKLSTQSGFYIYHFYQQSLKREEQKRAHAFNFEWTERFSSMLMTLPRPDEKLKKRFDGNVRCLMATKDDQLASCAWFANTSFDEDEVNYRVLLAPDQVWDFDVYVVPKYRLGRLFFYTWQRASNDLLTLGYQTTLSRISAYNLASVTTHEKLGAKRLGTVVFLKIRSFQITFATRKPYLAISIGEKGKPFFDFSDSLLPS
ncbi:hypothetical protein [Lacimicrobium sp. SS2-24]|uniref:GNAT family N-acetyltransferase n=1 Tax=Lacimicrobium sp. SS2-24 TaxID=2005569 RepID=UPI000B4B6E90|nr:hypothetical protein [Lacimicrobium sp. SS2-24]